MMRKLSHFGFGEFRCLQCGASIPSNRDFCSRECEHRFFSEPRRS